MQTNEFSELERFAPDPVSFQRAKGLVNLNLWDSLGKNIDSSIFFGTYLGTNGYASFNTSFTPILNLENNPESKPLWTCNCPSFKKPCKHALALSMLAKSFAADFTKTEPPEWIELILKKRNSKPRKKNPKILVENPEEYSKKLRLKIHEVLPGILDLKNWLIDIARIGIIRLYQNQDSEIIFLARRLVDSKLGTLSKWVLELNELKVENTTEIARILARLHSVVYSVIHFEKLPTKYHIHLAESLGMYTTKEEVLQTLPIKDDWYVISIQEKKEAQLIQIKTWFLGLQSKELCYILDFFPAFAKPASGYFPGSIIHAEAFFYPGLIKSRAILSNLSSDNFFEGMQELFSLEKTSIFKSGETLQSFLNSEIALNPLISSIPFVAGGCRFVDFEKNKVTFCFEENTVLGFSALCESDEIAKYSIAASLSEPVHGIFELRRGAIFLIRILDSQGFLLS
jgi:hypothetical protein